MDEPLDMNRLGKGRKGPWDTIKKKMKKSTLIVKEDLNNILKIKELVKDYLNDMELGGLIRQVIHNLPKVVTYGYKGDK